MNDLLFAFYGDDFTGSTDALEALTLGGIPTVLFLESPYRKTISTEFPDVRAIGIAGVSRSLSPSQVETELRPKFSVLKALGAPFYHYKTCSTFDSSPRIGSIGRAIDIGSEVFQSPVVPLVVGAPALRRYVTFGNLFATVNDTTYRIDRHPTMSRHPITPMDEGDLRLHLAKQTRKSISLVDVLDLNQGLPVVSQRFHRLLNAGSEIVLFDTLDDSHIQLIGEMIWSLRDVAPIFIAGSSGVEYALTAHWRSIGLADTAPTFDTPGPTDQIIVMSGSASPVTKEQIKWAMRHGFEAIPLNASQLVDPNTVDNEYTSVIQKSFNFLRQGKSLVLFSALGPNDPAIQATTERLERIGMDASNAGERLGIQQGRILHTLLDGTDIKRVCVAGGDTTGHAVRHLNIYALQVLSPLAPGAPLCRASSHTARFDGLEIVLKGGQIGQVDFFGRLQQGRSV